MPREVPLWSGSETVSALSWLSWGPSQPLDSGCSPGEPGCVSGRCQFPGPLSPPPAARNPSVGVSSSPSKWARQKPICQQQLSPSSGRTGQQCPLVAVSFPCCQPRPRSRLPVLAGRWTPSVRGQSCVSFGGCPCVRVSECPSGVSQTLHPSEAWPWRPGCPLAQVMGSWRAAWRRRRPTCQDAGDDSIG